MAKIRKTCATCKVPKPTSAYYRDSLSDDGLRYECKECHTKRVKDGRARRRAQYTPADSRKKKVCPACQTEKSATAFCADRTKKDGLGFWCRDCAKIKRQKWLEAHDGKAEDLKKKARDYYQANGNKVRKKAIERHRRLRQECLEHYSPDPVQCRCCGEKERKFLGIDHIDGGGKQHLKSIGSTNIYYWAKAHGYPPGFQVLCHNCNLAKGFYGECPHQKTRNQQNDPRP